MRNFKYFKKQNILKIKFKIKALAFLAICTLITNYLQAQCGSFNVSVEQDNTCNNNGEIHVSNTAPFNYQVIYPTGYIVDGNSNTNLLVFPDLPTGDYTIDILDQPNGNAICSETVQVQNLSNVINSFSINLNNGYDVSCFGECDASIQMGVLDINNPNSSYTFNWYEASDLNNPISSETINSNNANYINTYDNLCAGTYILEYTSPTGCVKEKEVIVREPNQINIGVNVTDISCNATPSGAIDISVTGGVGDVINSVTGNIINFIDYSYEWIDENGIIISQDEDIIDLLGGDYTIAITDANSCSIIETFTVNDPNPPINITLIDVDSVQCFGFSDGSIEISAVGGFGTLEYAESNPNPTQVDGVFTGLSAGITNFYIIDENGCVQDTSFEIPTYSDLSITTISNEPIYCADSLGIIEIQANGGNSSSYTYLIDGITQPDGYFDNLNPGILYNFDVIDANGCDAGNLQLLVDESQPFLSANITELNLSCYGSNDGSIEIQAAGGTAPYDLYIGSQNTSNFSGQYLENNLSPGNYTVSAFDANDCPFEINVELLQPAQIDISFDEVTSPDCLDADNGSISVMVNSGGVGTLTYDWFYNSLPDPSNTSSSIFNLSGGNYSVIVSDDANCSSPMIDTNIVEPTQEFILEIDSLLSTSSLSCNGDNNGEIFVNLSGGTPFPGNYYWLFVNDPSFSQQIVVDSITGLSAGVYELTAQDSAGCVKSITFEISEPDPITVINQITPSSCNNLNDGEAMIIISGGTSEYSLTSTSSPLNFIQLSSDTFLVDGLTEGTYFYDIIDENGCQKLNNSFYIPHPSPLEITDISSITESCLGWDGSSSVSVTGGTGPYTYLWSYDDDYQICH